MSALKVNETEQQQLFRSAELQPGVTAKVDYSLLPRSIIKLLKVGCIDQKALSVKDVIRHHARQPGSISFRALLPTEIMVGRPIIRRELAASEESIIGEGPIRATTWDILAFQGTTQGLMPASCHEKRRVLGLGCVYETDEGMSYPYLSVAMGEVVLGITTLGAFKLRPSDHILYIH